MGNTAENFGLKSLFIPLGIVFGSCRNFGFIRFEKGEIFWKKTLKHFQKTGIIVQLRSLERTELWTYPFVLDLWTNSRELPYTFSEFCFFALYFRFLFVLSNKEHIQSFQKSPWTTIFDHRMPELGVSFVYYRHEVVNSKNVFFFKYA